MKNYRTFLIVIFCAISIITVAENRIDSLKNLLNKNASNLRVLDELSIEYRVISEDSAFYFANKSLELSSGGSTTDNIVSNFNLASFYLYFKQNDSALKYFNIIIHEFSEIPISLKTQLFNTIGVVYQNLGQYDKSIEFFNKSYEIADAVYQKIRPLNNIGMTYMELKRYEKSLHYYGIALKLSEESGNNYYISTSLNNIGTVLLDYNEIDSAKKYFERSMSLAMKIGDNVLLSVAYNNLGVIFEKSNEYEKSRFYYNKYKTIKEDLNDIKGVAIALNNIGNTYLLQDDTKQAIQYLLESIAISEVNNFKKLLVESYELINKVYMELNNTEEAYYYLQRHKELKDSLFGVEMQNKVMLMEEKYRIEKSEKEIALKGKENDLLVEKNRVLQVLIFSSTLVVLILTILVFITIGRIKLRKKLFIEEQRRHEIEKERAELEKKKLELDKKLKVEENLRLQKEMEKEAEVSKIEQLKLKSELDHKERELVSNAMHLYQKNEMLGEIDGIVKGLVSEVESDEVRGKLLSLDRTIKTNLSLDHDWKSFKLHFEQVHPDFFKSLKAAFPRLTSNDLKICAYIRINISVKEISRLMNIAPNSVKVARKRLKKKLELEAKDSLVGFISSYNK